MLLHPYPYIYNYSKQCHHTADDIEAAITDLSPHSPQSTDRSTLSSMINSLTSFTTASVLSAIEDDIAPTNFADGFASEDDLFTFL